MHRTHPGPGSSRGGMAEGESRENVHLLFSNRSRSSPVTILDSQMSDYLRLTENPSALKSKPRDEGKTRSPLLSATGVRTEVWKGFSGTSGLTPKDSGELTLGMVSYHSLVRERGDAGAGKIYKGCWWWAHRLWPLPALLPSHTITSLHLLCPCFAASS